MPLFSKFCKIKSPFTRTSTRRRNDEEKESSLGNKSSSSVNHEYMEAFRTKSYVEIYDIVQGQLEGRNKHLLDDNNSLPSTSSSSSLQQTLAELPEQATGTHPLLNEYFRLSSEACKICEALLKNVLQTRTNYKSIKTAIKKTRMFPQNAVWGIDQVNSMYREFASFSLLRNPLSTQVRFNEVQDAHFGLLHRLLSKSRKLKRKIKLLRFFGKALGSTLVVGYIAFAIAFTILAIHCMVCIMAAPGLITVSLGISRRFRRWAKRPATKISSSLEGLYTQLDAAARGVYILINDFDTMSRHVGRLEDEMEHNKAIADLCAKKHNDDMLKEVARDFAMHEGWFLEQLKELEQHIYLCFLNIIRSRRMVVQEIMGV